MIRSKFLFVDNHKDTAELFSVAAELLEIDGTVCADSTDALKILDDNEFDAVILDLSMPVLDGLTLAEQIRANESVRPEKKPVCIVFFTGRTIDGAIIRIANRTGVRRIYQKPYDMTEMLVEIKGFCAEETLVIKHQNKENGHSSPNMMMAAAFIVLQIIAGTVFLWLNHRTQENWAIKWSEMKSKKDAMKIICDSNAEKKNALEIVISKNNIETAPELLTERPCVVETEETK